MNNKAELRKQLFQVLKGIEVTGFDLENFFDSYFDGLTHHVPTGRVQIIINGYYKPARKKIKKQS
jgi:hypothetical protein